MVNKYPQAFKSQCDEEDLAPRLALPSSLSTRAKVAPQGAQASWHTGFILKRADRKGARTHLRIIMKRAAPFPVSSRVNCFSLNAFPDFHPLPLHLQPTCDQHVVPMYTWPIPSFLSKSKRK